MGEQIVKCERKLGRQKVKEQGELRVEEKLRSRLEGGQKQLEKEMKMGKKRENEMKKVVESITGWKNRLFFWGLGSSRLHIKPQKT